MKKIFAFFLIIIVNFALNADPLYDKTVLPSSGSTLAEVPVVFTVPSDVMLAFSKSKRLKSLGRACAAPAVFNINEPVIFGCVAWNPVMMLPMWIIGIVAPAITWIGTKIIPFAPLNTIQFDLWYCPFGISTWLATQSFAAVILALIVLAACTVIWYPFFKAYEKQCIEEEANNG